MSVRTALNPLNTSCYQCTEARQRYRAGCVNCLNEVRLKSHFPKVMPLSSKPSAGDVEATVLRTILKRHAKNPHARFQALEAVKRTPKRVKPCSTSKSAGVRLVKKNVDHDTPAIWLHPAEGTVPTMHYYSWCALDRPTPRENKIYVNMENVTRPSHTRGEHCEKCIYDAWQNACLHMMAMDFAKIRYKEKEECNVRKQEAEMQRKGSVRKAFGTLRKSFYSQSQKEKEEVEAPGSPKPAKRQNASVRRIWRN